MTELALERPSQSLVDGYFRLYPGEAARCLEGMPAGEILEALQAVPIGQAQEVLSRLTPEVAAKVIALMDDAAFGAFFRHLNPQKGAQLLSQLSAEQREKRLGGLGPGLARELRQFLSYPIEAAGHIMDPKVVAFREDDTVEKALAAIRKRRGDRFTDVCLLNEGGQLEGLLSLQRLAVADPEQRLGELVRGEVPKVLAMSPREDVVKIMEELKLSSLPVVDSEGILLGIIPYDALVNAARQEAIEDIQTMFGAGRDERALSSIPFAIKKRLPWLQINLATAFLASSVVGLFEATIAQVTALAVFLPVVAGQSGNTGAQALAVTMRGLALREVRRSHWWRIVFKETFVGLVNGVAVALATALVIYFWADSAGIAMVTGLAIVISMVIAGIAGASIPIVLEALGQDPAQSSSIVLTTVTDVMGFLSFLGLATIFFNMTGGS